MSVRNSGFSGPRWVGRQTGALRSSGSVRSCECWWRQTAGLREWPGGPRGATWDARARCRSARVSAAWTAAIIAWTADGSWIVETTMSWPPQYPHRRASMSKVRFSKSAHPMRAGREGATGRPVSLGQGGRGTIRERQRWAGPNTP